MDVNLKDGRMVKLGRIRPKSLPACLRLESYLGFGKAAPTPPTRVDYAAKAKDSLKRMYLNDQYGDCVIAGKAHQVGLWTGNDLGVAALATDDEVYREYQTICGPGDNGCVITDVLDVMRSRGLNLGGQAHKIDGYVAVDCRNVLEVQIAILLFGSLTLGINLPSAWTCTDCDWNVTNTRIVGGHDVCTVGYDERGVQVSTWGGIVTILWAAFTSPVWIEECYASLSPDWYNDDRLAPNGVNVETLKGDLAKLAYGELPPLPTEPPPPGPPSPPPPPPPPPSTFTLTIPQQHVAGSFLQGYYVPAIHVQGQLDRSPLHAAGLPPWLGQLVALACAYGPAVLQPPWSDLLRSLCSQLPPPRSTAAAGDVAVIAAAPPWLPGVLRLLCLAAPAIPPPWGPLLMALCAVRHDTPNQTGCGCR